MIFSYFALVRYLVELEALQSKCEKFYIGLLLFSFTMRTSVRAVALNRPFMIVKSAFRFEGFTLTDEVF